MRWSDGGELGRRGTPICCEAGNAMTCGHGLQEDDSVATQRQGRHEGPIIQVRSERGNSNLRSLLWPAACQCLTLRTGQGPTGSQASSLLGCFFHPCCLAPEGGAPASWTLTPSPGELGSRKQPGSSGAHPVQGCVTALTPGNDVPGNAAKQE